VFSVKMGGMSVKVVSCGLCGYLNGASEGAESRGLGNYRNTHQVTVSGKHGFYIEQMNTEMRGAGQTDAVNAWQVLVSDINDPKNLGIGDINYWVAPGNKGAVDQFVKIGGSSIWARRIGCEAVVGEK
jgi:hypothetical protein